MKKIQMWNSYVGRGLRRIAGLGVLLILPGGMAWASNPWTFPPLPPPNQYGSVLIDRTSSANNILPVGFAHWSHRLRYTCRVCHEELDFAMFVNNTEITEKENRQGQYCGACHNGKTAFGHTDEHCQKCHSGTIAIAEPAFAELGRLPTARFGNKIDWSKALESNLIQPKKSLFDADYKPLPFDKKLDLESRWFGVPPAIFPHDQHSQWLNCSSCHPDIFNIQKKTTKHFEMIFILERKFCGVCHLNVAFPLDDCKRCHPKMKN